MRSRYTFERFILAPLLEEGVSAELARVSTEAIMVAVLGESARAKKAKEDAKSDEAPARSTGKSARRAGDEEAPGPLMTGQLTVLGRPEIEFFLAEARALAKEAGSVDRLERRRRSASPRAGRRTSPACAAPRAWTLRCSVGW